MYIIIISDISYYPSDWNVIYIIDKINVYNHTSRTNYKYMQNDSQLEGNNICKKKYTG